MYCNKFLHLIKKYGLWMILFCTPLVSGCVSVKAYQKVHLNDSDMQLSDKHIHHYENNAESYREGAAGGNSGKVGGGCGCN